MHKYQKTFNKTVNDLINYINSSSFLKSKFYRFTKNRKYELDDLIHVILLILKTGISYRFSPLLFKNNTNIHWMTIYKFFCKMVKYNIIQNTFNNTVKHILKFKKNNKVFITDTTLIPNKMGINYSNFNPQLLKHKCCKVSIIITDNSFPIDVKIFKGSVNDSKILSEQLTNFTSGYDKFNMLGDAGYDSNNIRKILKNKYNSTLICPFNKRNIKDASKIKKLSNNDKKKLKKRIKVEHIFATLKFYKKIAMSYEKYKKNYEQLVILALLNIINHKQLNK